MASGYEFKFEFNNIPKFKQEMNEVKKEALETVGMYVQGEAKVRAPVGQYDNGQVGGRLRDSIDYKVASDNQSVQIGTDVEYGAYVEKGTYKMDAQPYLTPAAEENLENIKTLIERELQRLSDKTKARG